jgi:hypothetical protein
MPVCPQQPVSQAGWFKSSHSGGNATECVEAAFSPFGILVRDSKCRDSPHLAISAGAWTEFIAAMSHITEN